MIIRDGRNQLHDLGPRNVFQFTQIKAIVGYSDTPGGWTGSSHHLIFDKPKRVYTPYVMATTTITCEACGKSATITANRRGMYCSTKCRNRIAQRRHRSQR